MVSTWAEHLRMNMRMTVDETHVFHKAWELHAADSEPIVRHFLSIQRSIDLHDLGFSGRTLRILAETESGRCHAFPNLRIIRVVRRGVFDPWLHSVVS